MNTVIANCQTGEVIERPATPEEIDLLTRKGKKRTLSWRKMLHEKPLPLLQKNQPALSSPPSVSPRLRLRHSSSND